MSTVMKMRWQGVTPDQYDHARRTVRWEDEAPDGGIFHVAWFHEGALHVIDVWQSADDFKRFAEDRLMPDVREIGIQGEPELSFYEAHRVFNPQALQRA